jgi:2-polyprenyl-3-methyl-5-hydroxy-6-metoxy-1,4-benzoquinol methylase
MSDLGRQAHWENVYTTKDEHAVSWFQERPDISLDLIRATGVDASAAIIDIGGGASRLVDALIDEGFDAVTVLDLSEKALATSKARLDAKGAHVQW